MIFSLRESLSHVAIGAEPGTRAGVLRQRLEALVSDVSKWVRPVARHSLGPFLATLRAEDLSDGSILHLTYNRIISLSQQLQHLLETQRERCWNLTYC